MLVQTKGGFRTKRGVSRRSWQNLTKQQNNRLRVGFARKALAHLPFRWNHLSRYLSVKTRERALFRQMSAKRFLKETPGSWSVYFSYCCEGDSLVVGGFSAILVVVVKGSHGLTLTGEKRFLPRVLLHHWCSVTLLHWYSVTVLHCYITDATSGVKVSDRLRPASHNSHRDHLTWPALMAVRNFIEWGWFLNCGNHHSSKSMHWVPRCRLRCRLFLSLEIGWGVGGARSLVLSLI